jgi:hypothetical protein
MDPTTQLPPGVDLAEARQWLELMKYDEGVHCPCCGQFAKVYWRTITSSMARALILFWREGGTTGWVHGPSIVAGSRADEGKLRYWGLIEEAAGRREDGGRLGFWRVTDAGERFVMEAVRVPKYALIYDGACVGFEDDETMGIRDALRARFSYDELMGRPTAMAERRKKR